MQLSDFTNIDSRVKSLVRRALEKWNPRVEARIIELFNEGLSQSDINKIITREGIFIKNYLKMENWILPLQKLIKPYQVNTQPGEKLLFKINKF